MAVKIELVGKELFSWVIKRQSKRDEKGNGYWVCECKYCKKNKIVRGQHFRNNQIEPCECIKFNEMAGKRFGKLILIEIDHYDSKNQPHWLCRCDCGNHKIIREGHILDNSTVSCGCHRIQYHKDKFRNKLIGEKFGYWTVISFSHKVQNRIHWLCRCECGTEKTVCGSQLKKGKSLSCGCKNNISRGEEKIAEYLNSNNIKHNRQQTFRGCKLIKSLRFDFYLPDYNLCIEFQGKQHYESTYLYDDIENRQERDKIKRQYCRNNNIKLLEIPYWEIKNIEKILKNYIKKEEIKISSI